MATSASFGMAQIASQSQGSAMNWEASAAPVPEVATRVQAAVLALLEGVPR